MVLYTSYIKPGTYPKGFVFKYFIWCNFLIFACKSIFEFFTVYVYFFEAQCFFKTVVFWGVLLCSLLDAYSSQMKVIWILLIFHTTSVCCSPYFQRIFSENPCKHPVIVLKDLRGWEVQAIVDFMYKGEISVVQEQLSSLIKAAESLQVIYIYSCTVQSN